MLRLGQLEEKYALISLKRLRYSRTSVRYYNNNNNELYLQDHTTKYIQYCKLKLFWGLLIWARLTGLARLPKSRLTCEFFGKFSMNSNERVSLLRSRDVGFYNREFGKRAGKFRRMTTSARLFFSEQPFYGNYSTVDSHKNTVISHAFAYSSRWQRFCFVLESFFHFFNAW